VLEEQPPPPRDRIEFDQRCVNAVRVLLRLFQFEDCLATLVLFVDCEKLWRPVLNWRREMCWELENFESDFVPHKGGCHLQSGGIVSTPLPLSRAELWMETPWPVNWAAERMI
jgi:hypothetical protein